MRLGSVGFWKTSQVWGRDIHTLDDSCWGSVMHTAAVLKEPPKQGNDRDSFSPCGSGETSNSLTRDWDCETD